MMPSLFDEITQNRIKKFRELFFQRTDNFPIQLPDGTYRPMNRPLTDEDIRKHLAGEMTIGSYTIGEGKCRWICWDFDYNREDAIKLFNYLKNKEVYKNSIALESTGGRNGQGSHCWIFFEPIPSEVAYHLGKRIAEEVGIKNCEIFPKQPYVDADGFGNLVKLPCGWHQKAKQWSVLIEPTSIEEIVPTKIPIELFEKILPPMKKTEMEFIPWVGCQAMTIIGRGVEEGARNESAFFRCRVMFTAGLTSEETLAALLIWNQRNHPPLKESEVKNVVESVYGKGKYSIGFYSIKKHSILGKFCQGCVNPVCEIYAKKKKVEEKSEQIKNKLKIKPVKFL